MNNKAPLEFIKSLENLLQETIRRNVFFSALVDINSTRESMGIADPSSPHRDREFIHSIQHPNHKLIYEISALSKRINDGTFGICDECLECIDIERLRVQPAAALCINCQREREIENQTTAA